MMVPQSLQASTDYRPALLWLMGELGSARSAEVIAEFDRRLGRLIPPEHRETNSSGRIKWEHYLRWSRQDLVNEGLMGSGGRGIWTITDAGRDWLREHSDENEAEVGSVEAVSQLETNERLSFRWRGQDWSVDPQQLFKQAKELLAQGPPPEAIRYQSWAIYIDGQPVSVKWLFHLVTGATYDEFDSPTARRALAQIGFEAMFTNEQTPISSTRPTRLTRQQKVAQRQVFLEQVIHYLQPKLNNSTDYDQLNPNAGSYYIQITHPEFPSSHYELRLARGFDEIAFHFEGSKEKNLARLSQVQPHVDKLSRVLGHQVVAEPWGTQWARLAIELKSALWTANQAKIYADLLVSFIFETFPLLRQAFAATAGRRKRKRPDSVGDYQGSHTILDRHINQIHEYLRGRAVRPSDEVLCEWVYFCYTFELFAEAARLFDLIDPNVVEPWPYDRAKKVARVCRLRAKTS